MNRRPEFYKIGNHRIKLSNIQSYRTYTEDVHRGMTDAEVSASFVDTLLAENVRHLEVQTYQKERLVWVDRELYGLYGMLEKEVYDIDKVLADLDRYLV